MTATRPRIIPSMCSPNEGSIPAKLPGRVRGKNRNSIRRLVRSSDESIADTKEEFQDLLAQAKGDTSELVRQNAEELERRLVLQKKPKIDKEDFNFFVENQK